MAHWRALLVICGPVLLALDGAAQQIEIVELIPVSVCRDATFSVPTSRGMICSGSGDQPHGEQCPRMGDEASDECYPYLASFNGAKCIAKEDAQCIHLADRDAWGCSFPSTGCSGEEDTPAATEEPMQPHSCPTWDFEDSASNGDPFDVEYQDPPDTWFTKTTTTTKLYNCNTKAVATTPPQVQSTPAPLESTENPVYSSAPAATQVSEPCTEGVQISTPTPTPSPEPVQEEVVASSPPPTESAAPATPEAPVSTDPATLALSEPPTSTEASPPVPTKMLTVPQTSSPPPTLESTPTITMPETAAPAEFASSTPSSPNMTFPPCSPIPTPDISSSAPLSTTPPTNETLAPVATEPSYPVPTPTLTEQTTSIPPHESVEAPTTNETSAPTPTETVTSPPVYNDTASTQPPTQEPTVMPCSETSSQEMESTQYIYETPFPTETLSPTPTSTSPLYVQSDGPAPTPPMSRDSSGSVVGIIDPSPAATPMPGSEWPLYITEAPTATSTETPAFTATTEPDQEESAQEAVQTYEQSPAMTPSSTSPVTIPPPASVAVLETPCPPSTPPATSSPSASVAASAQTSMKESIESPTQVTTFAPASTTLVAVQSAETPCPSTTAPATKAPCPSSTVASNTLSTLQASTQSSLPSSIAAVGISAAAVVAIILAVAGIMIMIIAISRTRRRNNLPPHTTTEHQFDHRIVLTPSDV